MATPRALLVSLFLSLVIITISCKSDDPGVADPGTGIPVLIFNSGFEPDTQGTPAEAHELILGKDLSYANLNDWQANLNDHPKIGDFTIQYQGGDVTERYARIIDDPTRPNNKVLLFWLNKANVIEDGVRKKGRIQANIYGNTGITAMTHSSMVYLHADFNYLKTVEPTIGWLTINEYWNNPAWLNDPYPFRITVNINKTATGPVDNLYFQVHGQTQENGLWVTQWEETNTMVPVPLAEWYRTEINFVEGNGETGKFQMAITRSDGSKSVVFDITNFTYHPQDQNPNGLSHFNPLKLYTSAALIDSMATAGKTLQVYWDDFTVSVNE